MRRMHLLAALLALGLAVPALPARADDRHDHDRDHERHEDHRDDHHYHDFHGHDFRFFSAFELDLWRHGGWIHDWHDGRFGWWYVVDGYWYWYPEPVYPYPSYVPPAPPPVIVVAPQPVPPPPPPPAPVVVAPPPPPPAPAGQAPAQFWYYCDESRAYYPYVSTCNTPWRQVPATH